MTIGEPDPIGHSNGLRAESIVRSANQMTETLIEESRRNIEDCMTLRRMIDEHLARLQSWHQGIAGERHIERHIELPKTNDIPSSVTVQVPSVLGLVKPEDLK